ncbi:hypothetical protein ACFT2C_05080 [Promicromonospora sp. NPDC057138]|uniref:hypothetical protein n=1 Tax=Promicromonospora sp. NPDC057138 TaxID=3346031 RepID=UPI00362E3F8D
MTGHLRDEDRADVVLDIHQDGHVTVTLHGQPWSPLSNDAGRISLGRTDVPWILRQLVTDQDIPLWVIAKSAGRTFKGLVVPEHLKHSDLAFPAGPPEPPRRPAQSGRPLGLGAS